MPKLLILVAVLLLPLGMSTAASGTPSSHHDMAGTAMGHCPDEGSQNESTPGIATCTMACAGALPAAELISNDLGPILCTTPPPIIVRQLHGLNPDTATPPPKRT